MFNANINGDTLTLSFSGQLDTKASQQIEAAVYEAVDESSCEKYEIDLAAAEYIASAFLRVCISISNRVGKDKFSIVNTPPEIKKIFDIAGLDNLFLIS